MSWQLVSFLILAAVLLGGFAWYERSRPPAQVVALVAALAALAIAGRIAFAAFPNVKPTTDIVIFAGYALGPAAGFAVGALAALVSNFWFGQGPWTPWQMAAWGLCGILGAALALGTRNVGRLTLAAVCGLAALGYGAILNFSLMATYGGELSWQRFGILEGRAIPFEVAHAAGNVVLALAAGPAMIRMLTRFRERFEWRRTEAAARVEPRDPASSDRSPTDPQPRRSALPTGRLVAVLLAVLVLGAFASAHARAAAGGPAAAAAWLESAQNEDGGYGEAKGSDSSQEMTGWAMLGLEAAGVNPQDVTSAAGESPVAYLQGEIGDVQSPGDLARTILALEGAGVEPREFGGRNLVSALLAKRRSDGSYEGWPNSTAYAVLALRSAGIANVADSLGWLREAQNEDGGWGDTAGSPSNPDGTGAVLQALSPSSQSANAAVNYLRQTQQKGGGWRLGGNGALNTQSTAWAVQGLIAAGANPAEFKRGGVSALEYLEGNQAGDGHYRYSAGSDQSPVWVTGQVVVATAGKSLPLQAPARAPQPKPSPTPAPSPSPEPLPLPLPEAGGVTPVPTPTPEPLHEVTPSPGSGNGAKGANGANRGTKGAQASAIGPGREAGGGEPSTGGVPGESEGVIPEEFPPGEGTEGEGLTTEPATGSDSGGGSVLGSIVAGLVVGALLFAIGYGPYRRWQSTHRKGGGAKPPGAPPGGDPGPSAGPAPINGAPWASPPPPAGSPARGGPTPPA
jgi:energy-coupling factor transport system substrate-specific component